MFYIKTKIDLTHLLMRFEIESFTQGFGRIDIWREMLKNFDLKTLLFGSYWEYEIVGGTVGPHNVFLSFFYFFGILPGFLFVYKNIKLISKQLTSRYFTSLFPIYIISLVYSSLSGHFTRVYPLYIILSILFELQNYSNNINNQAI